MKKTLISLALITAAFAPQAMANQAGDVVVRAGITHVAPDDNHAGVYVEALGGATPLSLSVGSDSQIGLNVVYFIDSNWAVELLAATPFTHSITINDPQSVSNGIFGADVDGAHLAEASHLPPTLSALYYIDSEAVFKPYVGLGINYTVFFEEEFSATAESLGFNQLALDDSIGIAAQIGADYQLTEQWHLNASARYINIKTDATFNIGTDIKGSAEVDINPWVYTVSLGYTF